MTPKQPKTKTEEKTTTDVVATVGGKNVRGRGRSFKGTVTKKFDTRVVIEFERTLYIKKYERFTKKKTRLHARVPQGMSVNVGDYVAVRECRPLSKLIHFIVTEVVKEKAQ